MSTSELTDKQKWLFSHGFYGHWWDLAGLIPYRGDDYHERFRKCVEQYEARWRRQK